MKKTESYQETRTLVRTLAVMCDKCGKEIERNTYDAFEHDWFELRYGSTYPEGGNGVKYEIDLCPVCSIELIGLMEQNGYKITQSEWDY